MIILTCSECGKQEQIARPVAEWYLYPPPYWVAFGDDGEIATSICDDCLVEYFTPAGDAGRENDE